MRVAVRLRCACVRLMCVYSWRPLSAWAAAASGQSSLAGTTFHIAPRDRSRSYRRRFVRRCVADGNQIDTWCQVQPGDNGVPPVKSTGYLTYDDRFFYAAFEFDDPSPTTLRAPLGDHDAINGNSMDFGGMFIDPLNTGRTAYEFLRQPARNVSVQRGHGRRLQERTPLIPSGIARADRRSRLGRRDADSILHAAIQDLNPPEHRGIILFRNYPRQYRYQLMSANPARQQLPDLPRERPLRARRTAERRSPDRGAVPSTDTARPPAPASSSSRSVRGRRA